MIVRLRPLSKKSQQILRDRMGGDPIVRIKSRKRNQVLLSSMSGSFLTWVSLVKDPDWEIILTTNLNI